MKEEKPTIPLLVLAGRRAVGLGGQVVKRFRDVEGGHLDAHPSFLE